MLAGLLVAGCGAEPNVIASPANGPEDPITTWCNQHLASVVLTADGFGSLPALPDGTAPSPELAQANIEIRLPPSPPQGLLAEYLAYWRSVDPAGYASACNAAYFRRG